jgi:hypothetical protein
VGIDLTVVEDKVHPRRRAMLKRAGLQFAPQLAQLGGRLGEIGVDGSSCWIVATCVGSD